MLHLLAFICTLLIPFALIWARVGVEICAGLIGLLFLIHCFQHKDWTWLKSPFTVIILVTYAWIVLVVTPFALDSAVSFQRAITWIRFPLMLIAISHWVLREEKYVLLAAKIIAGLLLFVLIDSLVQFFTGTSLSGHSPRLDGMEPDRLTGPLSNVKVGTYTTKLAFPVFGFLIWLAAFRAQKKQLLAYSVCFLACLILVLLSGERTAFITSFIAASTACVGIAYAYPKLRLPLLGVGLAAVALMAIIITSYPSVERRASMLMDHIENFEESPYGHLLNISFTLAKKHPITGVGLKNYGNACMPLEEDIKFYGICEMHSHNPYTEWLVEAGIIGLLLFLTLISWFVACIAYVWQHTPAARIMVAFGAGTLIIHFFPLMSASSTVSNWPAFLLWYSLSIMLAFLRYAETANIRFYHREE